jgi:hypothetical protein
MFNPFRKVCTLMNFLLILAPYQKASSLSRRAGATAAVI